MCVSCVGKTNIYAAKWGQMLKTTFFKKVQLKKVLIVRVVAAGKIQY